MCDHARLIVDRPTQQDALTEFRCARCKNFDIVAEKWMFRDVRVYLATASDIAVGSHSMPKMVRDKKIIREQLDWVELDKPKG
jgi:hypothetical protein